MIRTTTPAVMTPEMSPMLVPGGVEVAGGEGGDTTTKMSLRYS